MEWRHSMFETVFAICLPTSSKITISNVFKLNAKLMGGKMLLPQHLIANVLNLCECLFLAVQQHTKSNGSNTHT